MQIDTDGEEIKDFNDLHEVSWCSDKINKTDLEYIHISELKSFLQSLTDEIKEKAEVELDPDEGKSLRGKEFNIENAKNYVVYVSQQSIQTITDNFIKQLK